MKDLPWFWGLVFFLIFIAAAFAVRYLLIPFCKKIALKDHLDWVSLFVTAFQRPLFILIVFYGASVFLAKLSFAAPFTSSAFYAKMLRAVGIFCAAWGLVRARTIISRMLSGTSERLSLRSGRSLTVFLTRLYALLVIVFAAMMILSEFGFNVNGIVTGLGLGSLTFALAAQDLASNFFGGLVLILEHPFDVGDWIATGTIEGTVEDITFRSTKIRQLNDALTIVPNSAIASGTITNWTRLHMRMAQFKLGLAYATPKETVQQVLERLRAMLAARADVYADKVQVRLSAFSESSVDVFVLFYVRTTDINVFRASLEEINFAIMDIMKDCGASFAFPSRSLYFETPLPKEGSEA